MEPMAVEMEPVVADSQNDTQLVELLRRRG